MMPIEQTFKVYMALRPVDFRKGHDGLAAYVQEFLGEDAYGGTAFVFRSKRGDRMKVLMWDGSGLVLSYKRLEEGSFAWPKISDGVLRISRIQFEALFAGMEWRQVRSVKVSRPALAA